MKQKWISIFFIFLLVGAAIFLSSQFLSLEPASTQTTHDSLSSMSNLSTPLPTAATASNDLITSSDQINVNAPSQPSPSPTPTNQINEDIEKLLSELTLEEKIGQLLIIGIEDKGTNVSTATKKLIAEQGIGNVILFKRNISSEEQLSSLTGVLKELPAHGIPLWLSIDQEGGNVNRLPQKFPAAAELAELNDPALTEATGELIGSALAELAIDINFAPVLDVHSNPKNPVIGNRAFGSSADTVVTHSTAMLKGLSRHVITVGKHFPGHGDTSVDSHKSLPTINKSWEQLEELELIPFREAINNNIDAIMVGHLYLPQLDEEYPASLSPTIIGHYLRDVLGFTGVVITDDLVMGGITNEYELKDAALKALQAGNTMLIIGHHPREQQAVFRYLVEAVQSGELDEELINDRARLVLHMKLNKELYIEAMDTQQ